MHNYTIVHLVLHNMHFCIKVEKLYTDFINTLSVTKCQNNLHCIGQQLPQPLVRDAQWRRQSKNNDKKKN